jgi:serine phosphatase RsbU (regulator of sigma subunit)
MDICLVRFEKENLGNIQFSGANRNLFTIKDNQINEYKGDRQPVGFSYHSKPFHSIDLFIQKDTLIYMFTDGLVDQFGSETKKKLGIKKVKDFLLEISKKSMSEQEKLITDFFIQWKGDIHQMDDVTIVAIKI